MYQLDTLFSKKQKISVDKRYKVLCTGEVEYVPALFHVVDNFQLEGPKFSIHFARSLNALPSFKIQRYLCAKINRYLQNQMKKFFLKKKRSG